MNWRELTDEKEKYNAYLCSREWGVLREAVRDRCGGFCERCNRNPMQQVHHQTYIRKYHEELEDLVAVCIGCHEFEHGKRNENPAEGDYTWVQLMNVKVAGGTFDSCRLILMRPKLPGVVAVHLVHPAGTFLVGTASVASGEILGGWLVKVADNLRAAIKKQTDKLRAKIASRT